MKGTKEPKKPPKGQKCAQCNRQATYYNQRGYPRCRIHMTS